MKDLKQKVLENLKNKGYHEYQLKELNPIIQATIEATKKALNIDNVSESCLAKCDVCGCHPNVIIRTELGTFCQAHARYVR